MAHQIRVGGSWVNGYPSEAGQRYRIASGSGYVYGVYVPEVVEHAPNMKMTKLGFKHRFTAQERIDIRAAAAVNPIVYDFQDLVDSATFIDISRNDTAQAVHALELLGLIVEGRAGEILSPPITELEQWQG